MTARILPTYDLIPSWRADGVPGLREGTGKVLYVASRNKVPGVNLGAGWSRMEACDDVFGSPGAAVNDTSPNEPATDPAWKRRRPMIQATRKVTARDFAIFQLKLVLDGLKDVVLFNVSIVALLLDVIAGGGKRPRVFYSVLRASERFDLWLNLNGALELLDGGDDEDGLFGASEAGSGTLLGQIEQLVRGGDEPRGGRPVHRPERPEGAERSERPARPARAERAGRPEQPDRPGGPERPGRQEQPERPERGDAGPGAA